MKEGERRSEDADMLLYETVGLFFFFFFGGEKDDGWAVYVVSLTGGN